MKTKEELNKIKEEVNSVNEKLQELTEEELEQVTGGLAHLYDFTHDDFTPDILELNATLGK